MTEYENNNFIPDQEPPVPNPVQEQPVQQSSTYTYHGTGQKESPFADSPYVMNHGPQYQNTWQAQPQEPQTAPKKKKKSGGIWKKALAVIVVIALLVGSCGITAAVINEQWEDRSEKMEESFLRQVDKLQKQIDSMGTKQSASGIGLPAGDAMSPSQVYAYNVDSVVAITANIQSTVYGQVTEGKSAGSGFILTEDGYVITNAHVVEGASSVTVTTHDGTEYEASVEGADVTNDVAVLKVEATGLPAVTVGSSDALAIATKERNRPAGAVAVRGRARTADPIRTKKPDGVTVSRISAGIAD